MMPKVTQGRVDQLLTNVLLAYTNAQYIADKIFPLVGGLKDDTGLIGSLGNAHLRSYSSKRSLYDESRHRINFEIDNSKDYRIDYFDLAAYLPDRLIDQARAPFDVRNAAQMTVIEALKLEREIAVAKTLHDTSVLTNNVDYTSQSSKQYNASTSKPIEDIQTAIRAVYRKTGRKANTLLVEGRVADALRAHADIKAIALKFLVAKGDKSAALSEEGLVSTLKAWFKLDNVFITEAIKLGAHEGQAETMTDVWCTDIVAFYAPAVPTIMAPSFGYSFQLENQNLRTVVRRAASDKGEEVEVMWGYQDKIIDADAAYLIKAAVPNA